MNREIVVKALAAYFEADDDEPCFDDVNYNRDAREKANAVVALLKNCGWLEYEQEQNHQLNVVLYEYAIPVIEAMNRVIKEEEAEYQGIISQIHAGDIDVGGFYILEHLKAKTGISFRSLYMEKNVLEKYASQVKPLTENDRRRMKQLLMKLDAMSENGNLTEDYREVLYYMIEHNCKLEQEVVKEEGS